MPTATLARDAFFLTPHIVLAVSGLLVLLVDRRLFWWSAAPARRRIVGTVALSGVGVAMAAAMVVGLVPLWVRADPDSMAEWFSPETLEYLANPDPPIFGGTLAAARRQRLVAQVRSAIPLDAARLERLAAALRRIYGAPVQLQVELAPELVGGLSIRVGDERLDGSVRHRLAAARAQLTR